MRFGIVALAGAAVFVGIQFIPVDRTNPAVTADIEIPAEVKTVLQTSCYDCHSNQTRWPWYNRIAPVSWLITHDVEEAREHLNFSEWDRLGADKRAEMREEIWEDVEGGEMPLWFYLPMHPEARIDDRDRKILKAWASHTSGEATNEGR